MLPLTHPLLFFKIRIRHCGAQILPSTHRTLMIVIEIETCITISPFLLNSHLTYPVRASWHIRPSPNPSVYLG